jgi:hypothetical protein
MKVKQVFAEPFPGFRRYRRGPLQGVGAVRPLGLDGLRRGAVTLCLSTPPVRESGAL